MTWAGATALDIATAVRRNDATAEAVLHDHLDHYKRRPDDCVHNLRHEAASIEAQLIDTLDSSADTGTSNGSTELFPEIPVPVPEPDRSALPTAGVPVITCQQLPLAGQASQLGSNATFIESPDRDHEAIRRFKGTGAVMIATTRSSELGLWPATDQPGQVLRNPHHPEHSPGGPSGGAAAALALGLAPLAIGLDGPATAGGVRTAAASCGLFAYSPETEVTATDQPSPVWYVHKPGLMATTAADLVLGVSTLTNRDYSAREEPRPLRIAASTSTPMPGKADEDNTASLLQAVRALTDAGHRTLRAKADWGRRLPTVSSAVWATAAFHRSRHFRALQRRTRHLASLGATLHRQNRIAGLLGQGERARRHIEDWFSVNNVDLLITPALPSGPAAARSWSEATLRANVNGLVSSAAFTAPAGVTGLPAVVVPVGSRHDGLPSSVQLIGPPGSTSRLLAVASQLSDVFQPRRHARSVIWE
ncbi:amidase family protein [Salininema proteolyticum]|uniref:Amidase family protein n=1 Tax=Salininema proteolyticum TaxID=1607685 RepID=A0ABV8TTR7_9ACTN